MLVADGQQLGQTAQRRRVIGIACQDLAVTALGRIGLAGLGLQRGQREHRAVQQGVELDRLLQQAARLRQVALALRGRGLLDQQLVARRLQRLAPVLAVFLLRGLGQQRRRFLPAVLLHPHQTETAEGICILRAGLQPGLVLAFGQRQLALVECLQAGRDLRMELTRLGRLGLGLQLLDPCGAQLTHLGIVRM